MDIEKYDVKFGSPVLLTLALLINIPSSTGYIDCRISCRRCHKNTEHPAVLEVYCAMCEECKQRRRERMLGRTIKVKEKIKSPMLRMRDGIEASTDSDALMMRPQEALHPREGEQDFQQPFVEQQEPFRQPDSLQPPEQLQPQEPLQPPELMQPQEPLEPPELVQPPELLQEPQELRKTTEPQRSRMSNPTQKAKLRGMQYPYGCPTPPICSDTEEEVEPYKEKLAYTVTTTSTTATTQASCPPAPKCKKKEEEDKKYPCMSPCLVPAPMCPCYMYPPGMPLQGPSMQPQLPALEPQVQPLSGQTLPILYPTTNPPSTTIQDYHYVYIGLPKNSMRELLAQL